MDNMENMDDTNNSGNSETIIDFEKVSGLESIEIGATFKVELELKKLSDTECEVIGGQITDSTQTKIDNAETLDELNKAAGVKEE